MSHSQRFTDSLNRLNIKDDLPGSISNEKQFFELTKKDSEDHLAEELNKLLETANPNDKPFYAKEFEEYKNLFYHFIQADADKIVWENISPLPPQACIPYQLLPLPLEVSVRDLLSKLVVVKLNGGLGTSMGCVGPKSLISVRNNYTFLDLTIQQIEYLNKLHNVDIPLVLMNSFNTDVETERTLKKYSLLKISISCFLQSKFPRINKETLLPIIHSVQEENPEAWYPPGHGDFYFSFYRSGLLSSFIKSGKKYCFLSNIDNLGATVDLNILQYLLSAKEAEEPDFLVEVTDKTRADVKGGTLIQYENKLKLLELAQVPSNHVDDFKSISKFKIFNTNNLWINLQAIEKRVKAKNLNLEIIVNNKTLDNGLNVIQLETAAGSAIQNFDRSLSINVPRKRFLPVKKTSDLLLVMSDLYEIKRSSALVMNPLRVFQNVPLVKLGDFHFSKVQDFLKRFASIPNIIELDHLTVSGDVTFGKHVTLRGTVIIIANHGERIDIPTGSILENKIVTGNLRILDH
ncbi:UTP--glucose-1-phosphate uridylyltransferase-like [Gordionus sp. m RMFG-2023]|uniref:UTP--glucose-1-phosphate uridylyltransferase-like n=1 Tax=Gordionus sp. m RMFG-2023 TaxID=3053472 RepID=UPI0031FD4594